MHRRGLRGAVGVVGMLVGALMAAGCSGGSAAGQQSGPTPGAPTPSSSSSPTAPRGELPVLGEHTAVGADGVPYRVALHAVRRMDGATAVDWSVTVLPGGPDDALTTAVDLDLNALWVSTPMALVDPAGGKAYRPLLSAKDVNAECLCTPVFAGDSTREPGTPQLLQTVFPPLPADLTAVDVDVEGVPPFVGAPVSPVGQVPTAAGAVDLAAPASARTPLASTAPFAYPAGGPGRARIDVLAVHSSPTESALVWRLRALDDQVRLSQTAPPLTDLSLPPVLLAHKQTVASGPGLLPAGAGADQPTLRSTLSTFTVRPPTPSGGPWLACRCTDYQNVQGAVGHAEGALALSTSFGPLPQGATTVSVTFPGTSLPPLEDLPVTPFPQVSAGAPAAAGVGTWTAKPKQWHPPFTVADWPTPLPDAATLAAFPVAVVDDLVLETSEPAAQTASTGDTVAVTLDTTLLFGPDSAELLPKATAAITRLAQTIDRQAKPGSTVLIEGHVAGTDRGSAAVQQQLSLARARAVHDALAPKVSAQVTYSVVGRGATEPVASNDTEQGRRLNRRVVVTLTR